MFNLTFHDQLCIPDTVQTAIQILAWQKRWVMNFFCKTYLVSWGWASEDNEHLTKEIWSVKLLRQVTLLGCHSDKGKQSLLVGLQGKDSSEWHDPRTEHLWKIPSGWAWCCSNSELLFKQILRKQLRLTSQINIWAF